MSKFKHVAWCSVGSVLFQLCPNEFSRIEFRCASWKPVNMQARLISNKVFNQFSLADGMIVHASDGGSLQGQVEKWKEEGISVTHLAQIEADNRNED